MSAKLAEMIVRAMNEWFNEELPDEGVYTYEDVREMVMATMHDRKNYIIWAFEEKTQDAFQKAIEDYVDDVIEEELEAFIENVPWFE